MSAASRPLARRAAPLRRAARRARVRGGPAPRAPWTAALLVLCGLAALAGGVALGVVPLVMAGPGPAAAVGTAVAVGGLALSAAGLRRALRGRGWGARALAALACLAAAQWVLAPAVTAGVVTSVDRPAIPPAATLGLPGARDVTFPARDGVRLSAWYVPGTSGAAVVLLHGSHGTRLDAARHLRMLTDAGAAVLALDARGHGQSAGTTNALGWRGAEDVAGAVAFLRDRPGIDGARIGALGLSMGAEQALRAAAQGVPLAAVVADGAGGSTLGDRRVVAEGPTAPVELSVGWLGMRLTELISGEREPAPLVEVVRGIRAPVLLVAADVPDELALNERFAREIGPRAALWHVAGAGHTGALRADPQAYAARVSALLRALPPGGAR